MFVRSYTPRPLSVRGYTLVETLVALAVAMIVLMSVYEGIMLTLKVVRTSHEKGVATALANEQIEIIRNLTYDDVGVSGSIPNGVVPHLQTISRDGYIFTVDTVIRNIDDPFDGTIGGTPNDLSPADYRLVALEITCDTCLSFTPLSFTSYVGPRGLETASNNGALFVQVFDSSGQPVVGADVHVVNTQENPDIIIDDTTNNDGFLQIVDAPPGVSAYEIAVSKSGYSSDQTYAVGVVGNPNPVKPHVSVLTQQLSQVSFAIDETSDLNVVSMTNTCVPVAGIDFALTGSKLIGTAPDVRKFTDTYVTDGAGEQHINAIEWDTYTLDFTDGAYDLAGTIPTTPLVVNAGVDQDVSLIVVPRDARSVLVTVKDASTQLPVTDATVEISRGGFSETYTTGRGFIRQTDWSGGSGQDVYSVASRYFDDDGSLDTATTAGEILLDETAGTYNTDGYLTSSTFDMGSPSNFHQILWEPQSQPPLSGADPVKMQVATNNDGVTWNFTGPDGTDQTFYTLTSQDLNPLHDAARYLRYRVFLSTDDTMWTPVVSDISFTHTSDCVAPGQVLFSGLDDEVYTIEVSKAGYQTVTTVMNMSSAWQQTEVTLSP